MPESEDNKSSKVITVTSLKGGVGKSTITANLAFTLAQTGKRILAIDCDFNIRNLDLIMGLEDRVVYDFGDAIKGTVSPEKTIIPDPRCQSLFLCAAPYSDFEIPSKSKFDSLLSYFSESGNYDYIIIDSPGDSYPVLSLASSISDITIIVTTHNPASLRAAERTGSLVREFGTSACNLVINNFSYDETHLGYRPGILSIIDRAGISLLGIIPYNEAIQRYQEEGILIGQTDLTECKSAFSNIAARICGNEVPLFNGFSAAIKKRYIEAL